MACNALVRVVCVIVKYFLFLICMCVFAVVATIVVQHLYLRSENKPLASMPIWVCTTIIFICSMTFSTFYRVSSAVAVYAMVVCLSVCLFVSVTSRCSTKMAKHRKTQITPHDTIRYDKTILMCAQKLTECQLNLPHSTKN